MRYLIATKPEPNPYLIVTSGPNRTLIDLPTGAGDSHENTALNDEIVTMEKIIEEVQRSLLILRDKKNKWNKWTPASINELISSENKFPVIERAKSALITSLSELTQQNSEKHRNVFTKAIENLELAYEGFISKNRLLIQKNKKKISNPNPKALGPSGPPTPAKQPATEKHGSQRI
jgi:predicted  nucleic acid-binding Zn-ribbon protein